MSIEQSPATNVDSRHSALLSPNGRHQTGYPVIPVGLSNKFLMRYRMPENFTDVSSNFDLLYYGDREIIIQSKGFALQCAQSLISCYEKQQISELLTSLGTFLASL